MSAREKIDSEAGDSLLAYFDDREPAAEDFLAAVTAGFSKPQKTLPAKFFYDQRGSQIFDLICAAPEYYVTRTEIALLGEIRPEIRALAGPGVTVIEYGCGSDLKIRALLDALDGADEYVAIDISRAHLLAAAEAIAADYPALRVGAICADFTQALGISKTTGMRLGFFPGSTIGNQTPGESVAFLKRVRRHVGGGALLIGVDLRKDKQILDRAYDDAAGHTADFNLNLLHRINRELGGDIAVEQFSHLAFYNEDEGRVEMHLRCELGQAVSLGPRQFAFTTGETIHTENSYKYTLEGFAQLAEQAGFAATKSWTDPDNLFSIHYLTAA